MARKIVFRGQQTTTTAIAGNLTLIAAETGYQDFNPTCDVGDTFMGILELQNGQWETGEFTIVSLSPTVISRPTTPIASSNAGASITMSAGTHYVRCCDVNGSAFPASGKFDFNTSSLIGATLGKSLLTNGDILRSGFSASNELNHNYGNFVTVTLTANRTFTLSTALPADAVAAGAGEGQFMIIEVNQDPTGGWILSVPATPYDMSHRLTPSSPDEEANIDLAPNSTSYIVIINGVYFVVKKRSTPIAEVYEFSIDLTLALGNENTTYHRPSADTTARTWTIPANSSAPFKIGTKWRLLNMGSSGNISVPITTDTLIWLPTGGTGTRTIAPNGYLDLEKITATTWICSGVGVT